jgi:hypothetical protein
MSKSKCHLEGHLHSLIKGLWGLAEQLAHGQPLEAPAPVTLAA